MKQLLVMAILAVSVSTAHAEVIVDVTKIAGKSENDVSAYLGQPSSSCSTSISYGKKCQYQKGETEIIFKNGKADWITVNGIKDLIPFSKSALSAIGLKEAPPSSSNDFMLRWDSIQGLLTVAIFKSFSNNSGASKSDYAYIKVKTE